MPTIFSRIISGEIPSYKVFENENYLAFLDIMPLKEGHTLVIPKKEEPYIFNLNDSELAELIIVSAKVARAIEKAILCKRIGMAVIGLEVPHTHIHLVPIQQISDINFSAPKLKLMPDKFEEIAARIISYID